MNLLSIGEIIGGVGKIADDLITTDKERLVAVFEDRDRMVKMWRAAGVPCFQVADGEF